LLAASIIRAMGKPRVRNQFEACEPVGHGRTLARPVGKRVKIGRRQGSQWEKGGPQPGQKGGGNRCSWDMQERGGKASSPYEIWGSHGGEDIDALQVHTALLPSRPTLTDSDWFLAWDPEAVSFKFRVGLCLAFGKSLQLSVRLNLMIETLHFSLMLDRVWLNMLQGLRFLGQWKFGLWSSGLWHHVLM
jgi:hypothetical protein